MSIVPQYTSKSISDDYDGSNYERVFCNGEMIADADTEKDARMFIEEYENRDKRMAELEEFVHGISMFACVAGDVIGGSTVLMTLQRKAKQLLESED